MRREEGDTLRAAEAPEPLIPSLPAVDDGRDTYDPTDDFYSRMEFDVDPWERYYDR